MSLETISTIRKNRIYAPLFVACALLFAVFVLRPVYWGYTSAQVEMMRLEEEVTQKNAEYQSLLSVEARIQDETTPLSLQIKKIQEPFNEASVLEAIMINEFTRGSSIQSPRITLGDVQIHPGTKLPSGMMFGSVDIDIRANSVDDIIAYLTYLTQKTRHAFVLDSINLPLDTSAITAQQSGVQIPVTLWVYFYQ